MDTNVIAYLFLQGDKTALAQEVRRLDPAWIVPLLWRHEFLNVLATYTRRGGATLKTVEKIWQQAEAFLAPEEREVDMRLALEVAVHHDISAYDAQYIALARSVKTLCITEDRRLLTTFPMATLSMESFCHRGEIK